MSEYRPKVGDRVRVVLEGEVTYTNADGFDINEGPFFFRADPGLSVEKAKVAPSLPTTPGSVISQPDRHRMYGTRWKYVRVHDGRWLSLDGAGYYSPSEFDDSDPDDFEVIFDAGQVTP